MATGAQQLSADELRDALEQVDPVEIVTRNVKSTDSAATLTTYPDEAGLVLLTDSSCGLRCLLPEQFLLDVYTVSLATLAARLLTPPGVAITCVLGTDAISQLHLSVLARHVPGVSHIAICTTGDDSPDPVDLRMTDYLDLAGIEYSITDNFREAALGANLIMLAEPGPALPAFRLSESAVLVDAARRGLPASLVAAVDRIVVDDLDLVPPGAFGGRIVDADLPRVAAGEHQGRVNRADTILVELLGPGRLSAPLAADLYWATLASKPLTRP